ncbi:MAG: dihydrolipoyl dehydrogenase [bacterium]|nr:dihydrolipoyl dehydrogenase [bacterium]
MDSAQHDLIVIGAGPGGYVAAIRAAQLGLNTACIEEEQKLGGTCLRIGCIPSKALLEASHHYHAAGHEFEAFGVQVGKVSLDLPRMLLHKDEVVDANTGGVAMLFKKNKITRYEGHGRITGAGQVEVKGKDNLQLSAKHIIIATGSRSAELKGVELDYDRIGTSTEALGYAEVPKHLVVIGAGYIGLEMASVWARLGSKVTVLEYLDRILPGMDSEIASNAKRILEKQGLEFRLGSRVTGATKKGKGCIVEVDGADPIECNRVLLAVGRVPYTGELGLDTVGIKTDERGRISVNEHYATSTAGFYAIGDVKDGPMLAHKAEEEGMACVEHIVTGYGHVNYNAIPGVVYTHPEIASVGRTEDELKEQGVEYKKGVFFYKANGRARAMNETEGRVKILAAADTDRILGAHIIGARAGDLLAELVTAIEFGASSEDVARTSHAHPSLSEIVKEAALAVDGRAIHS